MKTPAGCCEPNLMLSAGDGGTIMSSTDGFSWTRQLSGTSSNLGSPAFLNGHFFVFGGGGIVLKSTDSTNWARYHSGEYRLGSVAYGNGTYLGIGTEPRGARVFMTSTNGESWMPQGTAGNFNSVVFGNGLFVTVGGSSGEAVISTSLDALLSPLILAKMS